MPLTETIAVRGVRAANLDYGRMRLWGSLTFIVAGLAGGGLVDRLGPAVVVWVIAAGAAVTGVAAHLLPRLPEGARRNDGRGAGFTVADARRLVTSPIFLMFLLAVSVVQGAHATFYAFGALHWRGLGIPSAWIGGLWAIGVLAEVALFAYSRAVNARFGAVTVLMAGAASAILRWSVMAFDPPFWTLVPLQLLHALSYGASHLGAMHFMARAVPDSASGTAQALYATFAAGVVMGAVTLASGPLYASSEALVYLLPAALAAAGLGALVIVRRRWGGGELWSSSQTSTTG
jgi:PPP family 3-phenylpropionic acid transporter